jgi:cytochrome c oxidase assembly protein subunit 15
MHRAFALAVLAVLALLAWRARHIQGLRRPAGWLALLLAVQFLTGLSNVVLQWPLVLAVAHSGGAALLVATMVVILFRIAAAGRTMHFTSR